MILFSEPVKHSPSTFKVVLLSGLSDPSSCALSRVQRQFLDGVAASAEEKIYANFPYVATDRAEQASIPILVASWRNYSQFRQVARAPLRDRVLAHWQAVVDSCEGMLVITLSCGLQFLNVCLSTGILPVELEVLALGPVAWSRPITSHTLVRGSRDYVFNPLFRDRDILIPGVGHLDYMSSDKVLSLANQRLEALKCRLASSAVACRPDPQ